MEDGGATQREITANNYSPVVLPPTSSPCPSSSSSSSVQRPHRCGTCQRSFREVSTLRKHEQLHRADRPYVCNTCGKSFLWSSNLKVHERVHTGERPYKCKICHRCFTQSNDLRRHERNVHMRGKLYGYRQQGSGGRGAGGGQVNLAAYQALALQHRVMMQHALTYEGYLHGQPGVFPPHPLTKDPTPPGRPPPRVAVGVEEEQQEGQEDGAQRNNPGRSPVKAEPLPVPVTGAGERVMVVAGGDARLLMGAPCHGGSDPLLPTTAALRNSPGAMGHSPSTLGHSPGTLGHSPGTMGHSPGTMGHSPGTLGHSPASLRPSRAGQQLGVPHVPHTLGGVSARFLPPSSTSRKSPSPSPSSTSTSTLHRSPLLPTHPHPHHHHQPPGQRSTPLPSFSSVRPAPSSSSGAMADFPTGRVTGTASLPPLLPATLVQDRNGEMEEEEGREGGHHPHHHHHHHRQVCDSIMDLSVHRDADRARPASDPCSLLPSQNPEPEGAGRRHPAATFSAECEERRDVSTTSAMPAADGGVHHCQHCNIVFSDFTMFHLHESLHLPFEDYPFRCPSCARHCQDRIEFMFHTVWHVKYPHTIPNYEPFQENLVS
ncbi:uncharacterized protein LOC143290714 [Babylonia areolata]|uniref:uncharacterized protein LOC143290714 n=1 Tax=Babylonia areolata TaxID=304850 RepID=UPI003FD32575